MRFLDAVRLGTPIEASIEAGYKVAEIAEAIELSAATREVVRLPLQFD